MRYTRFGFEDQSGPTSRQRRPVSSPDTVNVEVEPIVLVYAVRYALPRSHAMAMTLLPIFEDQLHKVPQDVQAQLRRDIAQAAVSLKLQAPWRQIYALLKGNPLDLESPS